MVDQQTDTGSEARHYSDHSLVRREGYSGPVSVWDANEARAILVELLDYFGISGRRDLPKPPAGLPGVRLDLSYDSEAPKVLRLGIDYLIALAEDRPRRQAQIWEKADDFFRETWWSVQDEIERQRRDRESMVAANGRARKVYFIAAEDGPIKIGKALDPVARLRTLQTSHPVPLSILAICGGGDDREREYHMRFEAHRLQGEWFARHPDILAEIERIRSLTPPR